MDKIIKRLVSLRDNYMKQQFSLILLMFEEFSSKCKCEPLHELKLAIK